MTATTTPPARPAADRAGLLERSALLRATGVTDTAPASSPHGAFAWLVTGACTWILVGLFLDGWFHIHRPDGESFFTPWHAILYSGVLAAVVVHVVDQRRAGGIRPGYRPSLAGGLIVLAAGFVDMVWHTVLGVEADLDALLSPPHLLLITAGTLVFAGPLRAAFADGRVGLPAAFSAAYVVTGPSFFTQYANPFTHLYPVEGYRPDVGEVVAAVPSAAVLELRQVIGVAGVVVFAALVGGAVGALRALAPLPRGALLVAVAVPAVFMTTLRDTLVLVPAAVVAGLVTEALGRRLRPAPLAAAACAVLVTGWAVTLLLAYDVTWSVELLTGAVGSAAATGFLAGWLVQAGARSRAVAGDAQRAPSQV
jgi:hypothetical protein